MNRTVSQSLFTEIIAENRTWRSYIASTGVHLVAVLALLLITVPAIQSIAPPAEHATLLAPILPNWKPKVIQRPAIQKHVELVKPVIVELKPKPAVIPPPVVKPQEPPKLLARAPEIVPAPVNAPPIPEVKLAPPAPPKPEIKTGVFNSAELAKGPATVRQVKTGGFGDPNGVPASANPDQGRLLMAKVGGFDLPQGPGQGGAGGHAISGGVRAAGFGSAGDPNGVPGGTGTRGAVRTGGFGDNTVAQSAQPATSAAAVPVLTPVEILYKPKPVYSEEARNLHLEGQVELNVIFTANGSIRVIRVLHGLGHGLDEAAQQAATQVRFKPATRGGLPVDTNATIYITFQLT